MSNQTQKLERLLARVQHNRESSVAKVAPVAAALPVPPMFEVERAASLEMPRPPLPKPEIALPVARPSASAVEPRISQAQPAPLQRQPAPLQAPQTAVRVESVVLAAPRAAEPSKPIAQVTSRSSSTSAPTFGDLLRRSLSLRPR